MRPREYPWHLPRASAKHEHWFKNLAEFHELTVGWLQELKVKTDTHLMTRGQHSSLADDLWILESLSERPLESFLDETSPDELLTRLDHTIWAVQAFTLGNLLEQAESTTEKDSLLTVLAQVSWKRGRSHANQRWSSLPAEDRRELTSLLSALNATFFGGARCSQAFLVRRSISSVLQLELTLCPHQSPYLEVHSVRDPLCHLHSHWIRGFLYELNHRISVENRIEKPRCTQTWTFLAGQ